MNVAIIGAGFTGLSAALDLARSGVTVSVFDRGDRVGGLATGFREEDWQWSVERFYHHIFTNDLSIIQLANSLGIPPVFFRPLTSLWWEKKIFPFDSPIDLLRFPGLTVWQKLRMGAMLAGFKALPSGVFLERWTAAGGLRSLMGRVSYQTIWEPLLVGKFGHFANQVNLAWFWARIKKRTAKLGTFPGGFQALADRMATAIRELGGVFKLNTSVVPDTLLDDFDAVLSTIPDTSGSIPYLDAHILFLEMDRPFLPNVYWLNILDRRFPFLVTGEQTNFVDPKYYNGARLLYVGNYLPNGHRLFSLSYEAVLREFLPWLRLISPSFRKRHVEKAYLFRGPFAQPIARVNYSKSIPSLKRGKNFFVANQAMIYPWDRGTNYAVELGQKAARMILKG